MSLGLIGKKIGMTQVFDEEGNVIPVTVIEAGPCPVLEKKTNDKFGYSALKLGFGEQSKNVSKPMEGYYKKINIKPQKHIIEFRVCSDEDLEFNSGDVLTVSLFEVGERINVRGKTKGKGFQGVIKRHKFSGGRMTHGSGFHRKPGSVGQNTYPSRVFKGKKLPGQTGNTFITTKNLEIIDILTDDNVLLLKGSLPGANGGIIYIKKTS